MDEYPSIWEEVSDNNDLATLRLRVPGGWLVTIRDTVNGQTTTTFVANPNGQWGLEA